MANVYGIEAFEYAPISADGSLPATGWIKVSPIADDAVTLTIPPVTVNEIRAADIDGVYEVLPGDTEPPVMEVAFLEVSGAVAEELVGGTWDEATKTYDAPAQDTIKKFAVRLTSKPLNAKKMQFWLRKAGILSNITISLVRNDLVRIGFTARGMTPVNASGVAQSPWGFKEVAVI